MHDLIDKPNPRVAFFDGIAGKWDGWEDLPSLAAKLDAGLEELGLGREEAVIDAGCGTGNLTRAILARMSPAGRVEAIDISARMIEEARRKVSDPRVLWRVADVASLPFPNESQDRVFCFAVWPHIDNPATAAREIRRVLKPGGRLHIWHLVSREKVAAVHASAGGPVHHDVLRPAANMAAFLELRGFRAIVAIDDENRYLVTAVRDGKP